MGSFSLTHWLIFGLIAFVVYKAARGLSSPVGDAMFCKACGHEGQIKVTTKGSIWIEVILWLCFLIPGLIYSVWRLTSKSKSCASCGSSELVPVNSPVAVAQKRQLQASRADLQ